MVKIILYINLIILLHFCTSNSCKAQTALTYDEKFAIIQEVYNNVFNAMGMVETQPELILDDKRAASVAYLKRNKDGSKTLAVEDKAFDICMSFGDKSKEALAFLIGHELGHFKYNHHWGKDFASSFALADIEDKLAEANDKLAELKYFETQADHSGGVSCFLAGYDIRSMGEPLLKKIYTDYNLPAEAPKYPSLAQRIILTKQNDSIVGQLITVFETANYAMLIGEYAEAIKCFEFVLNKGFKSREIYNNLGVCALLKAINLIGKETVKYVYPIEIDVESRLKEAQKGFSDEQTKLITKAKEYFTIATQLDKTYSTGFINLACAHSLAGEFEDGLYNANKAHKILAAKHKDLSYLANAQIILAILYDQQKKTSEAKKILGETIKYGQNYLAEVNLEIIKGKKADDFPWAKKISREQLNNPATAATVNLKPEFIDGLTDFTTGLEGKEMDEIVMNKSSCYYLHYKNSDIYNLTTSDNHEVYFQVTPKDYTGETVNGINLKSKMDDVYKVYGLPDLTFTTRGETIFVYKTTRIMIKFKQKQVSGWVVYRRY